MFSVLFFSKNRKERALFIFYFLFQNGRSKWPLKMAARYILPDSRGNFFSRWPPTIFIFFKSEIEPFQQCFSCFFLKKKKKKKKKKKITNKKKQEAAPKKEAGGDAEHVYFFKQPQEMRALYQIILSLSLSLSSLYHYPPLSALTLSLSLSLSPSLSLSSALHACLLQCHCDGDMTAL